MSLSPFPYTSYTDSDGEPLSNGYILLTLTRDASVSDVQLCAGLVVRAELDDSGSLGTLNVWPTDVMLPSGVLYNLRAYNEDGQLVLDQVGISVDSVTGTGFGVAFGSSFGS